MHSLAELIAERVAAGLKRKSLTTCSRWAQACRVMGKPFPGPWSFRHHPWLREMHDSTAEMNVGMKSAQMGFTEWALNEAFFHIDVKSVDCLYVLPAKTPDASDFSAARFDAALELSPHLAKLFSDVKNIGHKRAGTTNMYVRGSKSRSGLKSIPVGLIILDEVDEMEQDNVPLALERASGQLERMVLAISTPTIPKVGIHKLYQDTTQEHFHFKCPCCSRWTELTFPDCLEITAEEPTDLKVTSSFLKCRECGGRLEHPAKPDWLARGKWIPTYSDRSARGFHVSQLYSCMISPVDLAKSYLRAQRDPSEEQEFHNSKLGVPHIVDGAGVTDADIEKCIGNYKMRTSSQYGIATMGVDVGKWLHYEVCDWAVPGDATSVDLNVQSRPRVVRAGKLREFEELDNLMREHQVQACVIDANPERRKAYEFASRFPGLVRLCFYGQGIQGKQIHVGKDEEPTITVDRTSWLDLSLGRFRAGSISLPVDLPVEYKVQVKSPVRVYEKDKSGNSVGRYVKGSDDDHHAHARNYCEIALPFALSLGESKDIEEDVL